MNRFWYVKYKWNKDADKLNKTTSVDDLRNKVKGGINISETFQDEASGRSRFKNFIKAQQLWSDNKIPTPNENKITCK